MAGAKQAKKIQKAPLKMSASDNKKKNKKALKHARQPRNLIESTPKAFTVGKAILPKRDLTRYVKWPKYIRIQRQEKILLQRLRIPPSVNQFAHTLDKQTTIKLFSLMHKYRPETKVQKKLRLLNAAKQHVEGQKPKKSGKTHVYRIWLETCDQTY
uniref:60S ribosomal protein L7a n=1 Tax=Salmo salar TaxID=8030 RepID=B9EPT1_SALSA|nr:60S ribosomal protein L7a [Salmo salar]